jgi:hypothetical protein
MKDEHIHTLESSEPVLDCGTSAWIAGSVSRF